MEVQTLKVYSHSMPPLLLKECDERCAWIKLHIAIGSNKAIEFYHKGNKLLSFEWV